MSSTTTRVGLPRISTAPSAASPFEQHKIVIAIMLALAVAVGFVIAHAQWLYLGAVAGMIVALFWPVEIALGMFGMLIPFDEVLALGSGKSGTTLTYFVGAGAAAILLATGLAGKRLSTPPRAALWWALLVLWASTTTLWALNMKLALVRLPSIFSIFLLYLVAVSFRITKKELYWVGVFIIIGGCAAAVYSLRQFSHGVYYHNTVRASLNTGDRETDPNEFAATLLLPIALAIGNFLNARRFRDRGINLLAISLIGLAIFMTMSRTALMGLAVVIGVFLLRYKIRRSIIVPLVFLAALLVAVPQSFFTRVEDAASSGGAGRTSIWRVGEVILQHYGIFGTGLGNFPVAYTQYAGYAPRFMHFGKASHNIYLNSWAEMGILGLILMLTAVYVQLRAAYRARGSRTVMPTGFSIVPYEASCYALMVAGFFLDILWRKDFWLGWLLLTLAIRTKLSDQASSSSEYPDFVGDVSQSR